MPSRCAALFSCALSAALCACSPSPHGVELAAAAALATSPRPTVDAGRHAGPGQPSPTADPIATDLSSAAAVRAEARTRPGPRPAALALATHPAPGEADVPFAEPGGLGPAVSVQLADPDAAGAAPSHLLVWEFELRGPDGELVPSQVLAGGAAESGRVALINDAGLAEGSLVLVPLAPLEPGATYTAYFTARRAGTGEPVTRAWPFTTADG